MATVTPNSSSSSTKVIRIQEDEKELLFRLREIYGNDYKKYGEYIKQETAIPPPIKKIYKLLDERKAYRRISDYFHRERAAKKVKDPNSNGLNVSYNRSSIRGITQVPEQLPVTSMDHEMEYDDEIDNNNDDEENRTTTIIDNDQQQPESPAITNGSDELLESNHHNDDEQPVQQQQQHSRPPSIITTTNRHRKRILPMTNSRRQRSSIPTSSSNHINNTSKPELLSVRTHLEQALRELDRAIVSKPDYASSEDAYDEHQQQQSQQTTTSYLTNGYRHSKLDDIVRSLSNVVNQQQENARLIIDESSVLLLDDEQQQQQQQQQTLKLTNTQTSIKNVLARLNGLVDRGHTIYDRIESILSEF